MLPKTKTNKMRPIQYFINITRKEFCIFHTSIQVMKEIKNAINDANWGIIDDIFVETETGDNFNIYKYNLGYNFIVRNIPIFDPEA